MWFYSGIDHESEKVQKTSQYDTANTEHKSEFLVNGDQSGTGCDEVSSHLELEIERLNLKKADAGQHSFLSIVYLGIYILLVVCEQLYVVYPSMLCPSVP